MNEMIIKIRNQLKEKLPPQRYEHTISVSYICTALAMRYGADLEKSELAGLLHDCAKCYNHEGMVRTCLTHNISLTPDERRVPAVLHAKYGVWVAKHEYNIEDQEVLGAVRWHTTGKADMSLLEKIVFTADYIEPRRDKANDLPAIRSMAFNDLDECVYLILKSTLEYLEEKSCFVDSMSVQAYDYYKNIHKAKKGELS